MACKKFFQIALLALLLPLSSHSQIVQYYNRHFIAIKDTIAINPEYYLLLANEDQKSFSRYFRMDNSLAFGVLKTTKVNPNSSCLLVLDS